VESSALFGPEEKQRLQEKLMNRINSEGFLLVKNQTERSQLANKQLVVEKMNDMVNKALIIPKKRKATKPSKAAKEKRIEFKKKIGTLKDFRKKISPDKW
jgi:ribosome-associated protein